jgi:hypothetical protein
VGCAVASGATNFSLIASSNTGADQASGAATLAVPGTTTPTDVNVAVISSGTCPYLQLAYHPVNGDSDLITIPLTLVSLNNWKALPPMGGSATNWTAGSHAISVEDGAGVVLATANFSVCANTKATCP